MSTRATDLSWSGRHSVSQSLLGITWRASLCSGSTTQLHANQHVCFSDSITAELKTPTSFLTVRSSRWRVSASKTQGQINSNRTFLLPDTTQLSPYSPNRNTCDLKKLEKQINLCFFLSFAPTCHDCCHGSCLLTESSTPPISCLYDVDHDSTSSERTPLKDTLR